MNTADIRKKQAREKRRICRELKRLGISKKELSTKTGVHYQTVKWALNAEHPGWSQRVVDAANEMINPVQSL
jgi:lambda repressor-like predicted transcriptional regulator